MPAPASHRLTGLVVALAMASAVLVSAPGAATATSVGSVGDAGSSSAVGGCRVPLLDRATRGSEVKAASGGDLAVAADVNDRTLRELSAEVSRDRTLWLDRCGRAFHVEPADVATTEPVGTAGDGQAMSGALAGAATDPGPLSSALMLESKPGATKTIHLDFDGQTVSNTAWNVTYSTPITAAPYSITTPADTSFTDAELAEIQKAWQVVAEDYAPFDVNVTTKTPVAGAIERSGPADMTYGTRVLMTAGGPIYDDCRCGGVAYVDTFSLTNNTYYQPAWVFTNGTSTSGKSMGETASHEAGHNLGLGHDGAATTYYSGSAPWAPIMGTASNQPVSQWSAGEYPGATNTQDDLAIIATHLAVRADDHANTALGATPLTATPAEGVIATRADTDAFTFVDAGPTTIVATPGPGFPDLDIGLRILDAAGAVVAYVDPPVARVSASLATGLGATWSVILPETPAVYTAVVDGVGGGDPATAGRYSDYASLGNYRIALGSDLSVAEDLTVASTTPGSGTVGVAYSATPAVASGGTQPYSWAPMTALPPGLALDPGTAAVTGTPTTAGSTPVTVRVTDATGEAASTSFVITVDPAPSTSATVFALSAGPVTIATRTRTSFSAQLVAAGGTGAYTWAATAPPVGVAVSSTGVVAGSVSLPGTYSLPVTVTSGSATAVTRLTLTVTRRRPFVFATPQRLPSGQVARSYTTTVTTRGAEGRVTWKKKSGMPPGLRIVRRASGRLALSGRATVAGVYSFRLVAADATGVRRVRRFTLFISR